MNRDILTVIQDSVHTFSKGQRKIANFILESYDKAAFMTASRLGKRVGVSESTVVRFASELGYDGYPDMQRSLQKMIRNRLTTVQRIEVTNDRLGDQDLLSMVLQSDVEKIRQTLEELDSCSSAAIASFLHFYFNLIFDNVVLVSANTASETFESLLRVGEGDAVIGISFPRYSSRTVQALSFARDRGATAIAITDSETSPLAPISRYTLTARSDMASFVDSLAAPLSLVNALLVAVSQRKNEDLAHTFHTLEEIWEEYNVYEKVPE